MELEEKKKSLVELGIFFKNCVLQYNGELAVTENAKLNLLQQEAINTINHVKHENGWFTEGSVLHALNSWAMALQPDKIEKWLKPYSFEDKNSASNVGVIMAGNIPLVGLHDALCVLVSGKNLLAKLSTKDKSLMLLTLNAIKQINKVWANQIFIVDQLKNIDELIATGSDNSSRYFDYYFKDKKRLLRKNRTSIAILTGNEDDADYENLAHDIFTYFGLGCRNVTKIFVPNGFDLDLVFKGLYPFKEVANNNKYANNYDYNKAVYLLNKVDLIENGFILLKEDEGLHSPVGVLFYEYYSALSDLKIKLAKEKKSIQCIVTKANFQKRVAFGQAQSPNLWDYADGVDTLKFLLRT